MNPRYTESSPATPFFGALVNRSLTSLQIRNNFSGYLFENRDLLMLKWIVKYELIYSHISVAFDNIAKRVC